MPRIGGAGAEQGSQRRPAAAPPRVASALNLAAAFHAASERGIACPRNIAAGPRWLHRAGRLLVASALVASSAWAAPAADPPLGGWDRPGEESKEDPDSPPPPGAPDPNGPRFEPKPLGPESEGEPRRPSHTDKRRAMSRLQARVDHFDFSNKVLFEAGVLWRSMPSTLEIGTLAGSKPPPAPESGPALGVELGYAPVQSLEVFGRLVWQPTRLRGLDGKATMLGIRGGLRALVTLGRVRPYMEIAGGGEWLTGDVDGVGSDIDAAVTAGAGVRLEISPAVGFRVGAAMVSTDGRDAKYARIWELAGALTIRFTPTD